MSQDVLQEAEYAIWQQNPGRLYELPVAPVDSWAGSVQIDLLKHGLSDGLPRALQSPAPYPHAVVLMLIKDEEDVIGHNLKWLHHTGFRKYVLMDNGSKDQTAEIISDFQTKHPDSELIVIKDSLLRYIQGQKVTAMLRFAVTIWSDLHWVFPIDADEFLIAAQGLAVLDTLPVGADALTIPKVVHFQHRDISQLKTDSLFERMTLRNPPFCVPPKIACRANMHFKIAEGNHKVLWNDDHPPGYRGGLDLGMYYREFQTRSFRQFKAKVENGSAAIVAANKYLGYEVGGDHWLSWRKILSEHGENGLRAHYEAEFIRVEDSHFVLDPFYECFLRSNTAISDDMLDHKWSKSS